jgi:Zn-dependent protease with chaperone function
MIKKTFVAGFVSILVSTGAFADKLQGYLWNASASSIVVDGVAVRVLPDTRIERPNHEGITASDLRAGWQVEVDARQDSGGWVAKKVKVKNRRNDDTKLEGVLESNGDGLTVDGYPIRWAKGIEPPRVTPGMRIKAEGTVLDDGTIELKKGEILPAGFDPEEQQFMAAASEEVAKLKMQLKPVQDPQLQGYVERVGRSLVPAWVDPQVFNFNFSIIADPSLNAFALPDGTVVVHTGLLAALENEAQLATVLGHEIAHVTHRHGYRGYKHQTGKMKWLQLGALVGGVVVGTQTDSALAGLLTGLGSNLAISAAVNGHGRNLEDDADRVGLHYMVDAGYYYMEAPEVWQVFSRYVDDQDQVSNFFFSDHSTHEARIRNLNKEIATQYRGQVERDDLKVNEEQHQQIASVLAMQNAAANFERGNYRAAGRGFSNALDRNPNDAMCHLYRGKALWKQYGRQAALDVLQAFDTAAQLDPTLAEPYLNMGIVFFEIQDMQQSALAFRRYLEMRPDAPEGPKIRSLLALLEG